MKISNFVSILNSIAPFFLQEDYDNSGIQFGDLDVNVDKVLLSLDVTEDVIDEAIQNKANVILSHHPILFFPVKDITRQQNPVLFKALSNKINLIAMHTNFDLAENGLNDYVGGLLGIKKTGPIEESKEKIYKFAVYVPVSYADKVRDALFNAGAGRIGNYAEASFNIQGKGTFTPLAGTHPFIGKEGEREETEEIKIETVLPERILSNAISEMKRAHPYEEPAYDVYEIKKHLSSGIGMIGNIEARKVADFARFVKKKLDARYVRLIKSNRKNVEKVALCTGAGSSLIEKLVHKVDLYITGDITYHTALSAQELGLNVLDVEHFDTEKFFVDAMYKRLVQSGISKEILLKSKRMHSPYKIL